MTAITLWLPEPDLVIHQALGKAAEETGELAKELARAMIQGLDASDPKTGKTNRQKLLEEIADLDAAVTWLREVADLGEYKNARVITKLAGFREWARLLTENETGAGGDPASTTGKAGIVPRDPRHHAELDATHRKHPDGSYFK